MLDDVEVLKQYSPTKENGKPPSNVSDVVTRSRSKRSYEDVGQDDEAGMGGVGRYAIWHGRPLHLQI